jgi:hypothetical protein
MDLLTGHLISYLYGYVLAKYETPFRKAGELRHKPS